MAPDTPREPFKFDYGSLSPAERAGYEAQARKTLHMEPEAGRTMAKLMLDARAKIDSALKAAQQGNLGSGFNPQLATGGQITQHYKRQLTIATLELTAASEGCTNMANQFLAMEYAYLTTEANNATRYDKWKDPQGNDSTQIEI